MVTLPNENRRQRCAKGQPKPLPATARQKATRTTMCMGCMRIRPLDMIPAGELERLAQIDYTDEEALIIDEVILLTSRERQLLESIQKYQDAKNGLSLDGVTRRTVESEGVKGSRSKQVETTTRTRDVFDVIQKLQAELTKVQKEKRQYLSELRILRAQKPRCPKEDNTHERVLQDFSDDGASGADQEGKERWMSASAPLVLEAERELARRKMGDFVLYVDHNYRLNWHHRLLCEYLDQLAHKQIRRLMVFMPPRHGKSELVSRKFPAFLLGQQPDTSIISCSYSADLAQPNE